MKLRQTKSAKAARAAREKALERYREYDRKRYAKRQRSLKHRRWLKAWIEKNRESLRLKARARYLANREEILRRSRIYNRKNADKRHRYAKRWYREHKDTTHRDRMLKRFGITVADYEMLLKKQMGRCAICRTKAPLPPYSPAKKRFAVDHCHRTGRVRGILCGRCNSGVGQFRDSPNLMRAAARYLER